MSEELEVSKDFLDGQLCQTVTKSVLTKKDGGPYLKSQKKTRRDEILELHFEYGYSSRKISNILNEQSPQILGTCIAR